MIETGPRARPGKGDSLPADEISQTEDRTVSLYSQLSKQSKSQADTMSTTECLRFLRSKEVRITVLGNQQYRVKDCQGVQVLDLAGLRAAVRSWL